MVRKVKFPLEMANGVMARTLEEVKENFDIEKIILHYRTGKLLTWLEDRYYESEAEQVRQLNYESVCVNEKLCSIFNIDYCEEFEVDIEVIEQRRARLEKLKQFTSDEQIIKNVDKVVFNQEEMAELLDNEEIIIYLCGENFNIPLSVKGITYIGVNNPIITINSKTIVDLESKGIVIQNIRFNEEYKNIIDIENSKVEKNKYSNLEYTTSKLLDFMMNSNDRKSSKKLFDIIINELGQVSYDAEKNTRGKVEIIKNENLNNIFNNYLNRIS